MLLVMSACIEGGSGTGWTLYPPLAGIQSHSGPSVDLAILSLHISGTSSLVGAINFMATVLTLRMPGTTLYKLTLFGWAVSITAVLLLLSLPVLAGGLTMLITDRNFNTSFFEVALRHSSNVRMLNKRRIEHYLQTSERTFLKVMKVHSAGIHSVRKFFDESCSLESESCCLVEGSALSTITLCFYISTGPNLSPDKKVEESSGGALSNEAVFLGPVNSKKTDNPVVLRFHSFEVNVSWAKVKVHFKTGSAKSPSLIGKVIVLETEHMRSIMKQLRHLYWALLVHILYRTQLTKPTLQIELNLFVSAYNANNGNPEIQASHNMWNLLRRYPMPERRGTYMMNHRLTKRPFGYFGDPLTPHASGWAKGLVAYLGMVSLMGSLGSSYIQETHGGIVLSSTYRWPKLNLDICNSVGGKIVEKAKASGNAKDSETLEKRRGVDFTGTTHTVLSSSLKYTGQNSILLGNTSKGPDGRRQLSTGRTRQDLPLPETTNLSEAKLWGELDWGVIESEVKKGQEKLVTLVGEKGKYSSEVAKMQVNLAKTLSFRAAAVRKVMMNKGGETPGYDGIILKTPNQKASMVQTLRDILTTVEKQKRYKTTPVRRVMIPKANGKLRPLGIPTIRDRCLQQLLNLVLVPVVEMYSDPNSYGFRAHRGAKNAVAAVRADIQTGREWKWVLDADIKGFFDNINHDWIMKHIPLPSPHKTILKGWLESGAIQKVGKFGEEFVETITVTPQGSIISPTISNFVLNGLEECIQKSLKGITGGKAFRRNIYKDGVRTKMLTFHTKTVRYADDFVVITSSRRILELRIRPAVEQFLKERGVSLSEEKTKMFSISSGTELNFLGYTFKYRTKWEYKHSFFKERIGRSGVALYPQKRKLKDIKDKLRKIFRASTNISAYELISKVNPIIRGWANYFNLGESVRFRDYLRFCLYKECWRWARKKHPKWGKRSIATTYFLGSQTKKTSRDNGLPGSHIWTFYGTAKTESRYSESDTGKERTLVDPTTVVETVAGRTFAIPNNLLHVHAYHEDINQLIEFLTKANFKSLGKIRRSERKAGRETKGWVFDLW